MNGGEASGPRIVCSVLEAWRPQVQQLQSAALKRPGVMAGLSQDAMKTQQVQPHRRCEKSKMRHTFRQRRPSEPAAPAASLPPAAGHLLGVRDNSGSPPLQHC